jgi:hypothetical protein
VQKVESFGRNVIGKPSRLVYETGILENKLYNSASFDVLFNMSKKSIMLIALALVLTLTIVAVLLPPQPRTKKHGTRIHDENSISSFSFTLTNNSATNRLPVSKP